MSRPTLGVLGYIYQGVAYDIPFVESVKSVIDVVDEFVLCECYSTDGTWELCQQLKSEYPDKLKLIRRPWVSHFVEISALANFVYDHVTTDYVMELQSDEVVHERDLEKIAKLPEVMQQQNKTAARWNYLHFLNTETTFPFCYSSLIRVVKTSAPWRIIGDGVQFAINGSQTPEEKIYNTDIEVFHYGKMKDPEKGFNKEVSFQDLFKSVGFPDPKMAEMKNKIGERCDYLYLFRDHVVNKTITKFLGTHPAVMAQRLAEFKSKGFDQFISEMEANLKIDAGL